ncbi:hypothetical protein MCEJIRE27_00974 [Candidatus Nanopelagicaceae bacterium]
MKKTSLVLASLILISTLSACGGSSSAGGSFGDACPIIQVHATEMAIVVASVPVAVEYDQRRSELSDALAQTSFTDLQSLKLSFNADMNTVLGFSGSLKPPTGEARKTIEDLRQNVWNWDWTSVSTVEEVNAIMDGFAAIDEGCSKSN